WDRATKREERWVKRGKAVIQQYRSEKDNASRDPVDDNGFNILWSNTEIMRPSLYNQTPRPDVRRRFRTEDPSGKTISQVLERALSFSLDDYDFDQVMADCVDDMMLPGRGVARVRYTPFMQTVQPPPRPATEADLLNPAAAEFLGEDGIIREPEFEVKVGEEVTSEHWDWQCFRRGAGRKWEEVMWIGFEHRLTEKQGKEQFRDQWDGVELDFDSDEEKESKDKEEPLFSRAVVYEIWDKEKREVIWIARSKKEAPLGTEQNTLGLKDFFPIPRPLYAVRTTDSLVPIEEYRLYKSQAEELNRVTIRIRRLIAALKVRGAYDATLKELGGIFNGEENRLEPLADSLAAVQAAGGLDKAIWFLPIEKIAQVLAGLYNQREQIKQTIFEITGLSDILRGATDPNETLGAQQIKASTGSLRLQRKQREVQRFARDIIRLKAELVAENFSPQTLTLMTQTQVTPEMVEIMKDDGQRGFRIDIETDSTIAADQATDQRNLTELLTGITQFASAIAPAVQEGIMPLEAGKAILMSAVRRFKLGREVEDALDTIGESQQDDGQQQAEQQAQEAAAQAQIQAIQTESKIKQFQASQKAQEVQNKGELDQLRHQAELRKLAREEQENLRAHEVKMQELAMRQTQLNQGSAATQ
ncbi:MAG: hypothetical protein ACR2QF_04205, partial [Geminicoccaceae bacterium]